MIVEDKLLSSANALGIIANCFTTSEYTNSSNNDYQILSDNVVSEENNSIFSSFSESKFLLDDSFFEENDILKNHKISRKNSYKLRELNKKNMLLAGKSSCKCGSVLNSGSVYVDGDKNKNSTISNISHCNSVYQCRICASRILSQRQLEIETINKKHIESGGSVLLVSLTIKNSKFDSFESLLGSSKKQTGILWAYSNLSKKYKRRFKKLLDIYSVDFSVRVFESTWGNNGFHVHTHSLFYLKRKLSEKEISEFKVNFYKLWKLSLKDVGLTCNFEHGIDIQDGSNAGKYIAKWSGASELSSGHVKKAKNGNYTIAQLENLLIDKNQTELPIRQVKAVLKEYYKGCYGKKFMTWSGNKKQKDKYLIDAKLEELSDEECVESSDVVSKERVVIGNSTFKNIYLQNKVHELRTLFEFNSFEGVLSLARSLSLSTSDIHFSYDLTITEEEKLKRIDYFKTEFSFFPEYGNNIQLRDYFVLNYNNLLETALAYYVDKNVLIPNNAYYPYVLDFCNQYKERIFFDNS